MSENKDLTSSVSHQTLAIASDVSFSPEANQRVMEIVAIAEAKNNYFKVGMSSQSFLAVFKELFAKIIQDNYTAEKASKLINDKNTAMSDHTSLENKKAA